MKKELKHEDIENLSYKDIAFLILEREKNGINTLDLFTRIVNLLELSVETIENKIADFYTSLATDKRFILVDGVWDLRKRHTSDKIIVDEEIEEEEEEDVEIRDDEDLVEDEYGDEYTDDSSVDADFDDTDDDDLSDLVVIDEEDLN
ncbi:MAG: DNA-directed RNA polymerase subunit delta [Bacilli bacterium]|nr:DNA-directed RNA polymerase subunit delta [Bacilli bacterium]